MFREKELPEILDMIYENLEVRSNGQIDENRTRDLENRIRELEENRKVPECPVCFERFQKDRPIFSCGDGHHLCGSCKSHRSVRVCPRCRKRFTGRAIDFENHINELWG